MGPKGYVIQSISVTLTQRLENLIFIFLKPFLLCGINDITKSGVISFTAFSESILHNQIQIFFKFCRIHSGGSLPSVVTFEINTEERQKERI